MIVTGDARAPIATIVDTTTGELTPGPSGDRLLATSADGKRVATMASQGAPIVIRDMAGWLAGDGSSIASVEPPNGSTTAITFALDTVGSAPRGRLGGERRLGHAGRPRRPLRLAPRLETRHRLGERRSRRLAPLDGAVRNRESRRAGGAGEGGVRAPERAHPKVRERGAEAPTNARAAPAPRRPRRGSQAETGSAAAKMDTCASSGSMTPKTFWRVRRWTHEPQLSK